MNEIMHRIYYILALLFGVLSALVGILALVNSFVSSIVIFGSITAFNHLIGLLEFLIGLSLIALVLKRTDNGKKQATFISLLIIASIVLFVLASVVGVYS